MQVALGGNAESAPDDPLLIVPPTPVAQSVAPGPVSQARIEDLQVWSALQALSSLGRLTHPVEILAGADPPDRVLRCPSGSFGVELTELTLQQLRASLSQLRRVARHVEQRLLTDEFGHLGDRLVAILDPRPSKLQRRPFNVSDLAEQVIRLLREDRGFVGEGLDFSAGLPSQWNHAGLYGELDGLHIQVMSAPRADPFPVPVIAAASAAIALSEVRKLVQNRIKVKDTPGNAILLVSCGLLDKAGFVCPADLWLFHQLKEHGLGRFPEPSYLDSVVLHHWGTTESLVLYARGGTPLPWKPS